MNIVVGDAAVPNNSESSSSFSLHASYSANDLQIYV